MRIYPMAARMPLDERFAIAGTTCLVHTNCRAVLDALGEWRSRNGEGPRRSFELSVQVDSSAAPGGEKSPHFRGLDHWVFAIFGHGELFVFDLLRLSVAAVVSPQTAENAGFWRTVLVPLSLGVMGTAMGLVPLHSACLDFHGRGLLIAGPSGAGKSTLAAELARRGFSFVSDDWTYLDFEGGRLEAYGLRAPVKLLTDAPRLFPELSNLKPEKSLNGEMAFEVDPHQWFGSRVRSKSHPTWLVFLERTGQGGFELEPCGGARVRKFFENSVERLPAEWSQLAATRSKIIGAVATRHCWILRYGGPPRVAAAALADLCERTLDNP
jgi:HPr Serine kinase C-terminal domain